MNIAIVYVYPAHLPDRYEHYALRFVHDYVTCAPGTEHESIVVINGGPITSELRCLFSPLRNCRMITHDNTGYDIGGFQRAARESTADMIVFFGASTYFRRGGWLIRMRNAFVKHGDAQYGAMGNRGDAAVRVWPHIRTTAFWIRRELFNEYPIQITRPEQRHPFEHGQNCLTQWLTEHKIKSWVITWARDLIWQDWDSDPNGYQRGNQSSLLAGDHLCEPPYYPRSR